MNKFAPIPWKANEALACWLIKDSEGNCIAEVYDRWRVGAPAEANARRIVQCVNNFDDLLAACQSLYRIMLDGMTDDYDYMTEQLGEAQAAIANATRSEND